MANLSLSVEEEAAGEEPQHPIREGVVEQAITLSEADVTVDTLHDYLETVQEALKRELTASGVPLYDPMKLMGKVANRDVWSTHSPYEKQLYLEDGMHALGDESRCRNAIATKRANEEWDKELDRESDEEERMEWRNRQRELFNEVSLDDYTDEEIRDAVSMTFGIWEAVSELLCLDRESNELKAVKIAHELEYDKYANKTEYGDTGFVIGLPDMFYRGMRTEQRTFSEMASSNLSPAQLVDVYGFRVSYSDPSKWASKRGVSTSAVSQNRSNGWSSLTSKYDRNTIPIGL